MFLVDNFSVIWIVQRTISKLSGNFFLNCCKQGIFDGNITEDIIRGYTGLPAI